MALSWNVFFTVDAQSDLARIADYIARDSPIRALSFIDELQQRTAGTLAAFPLGGSKYKGKTLFLSLSEYIVLYDVDIARRSVDILHIVSARTNWKKKRV